MDDPITHEELVNVLKSCKTNKSPGPDGISYEFYKNLPLNWVYYIENLFNKIMVNEKVPHSWSEMHACMLHKKGDTGVPENYRCISLTNCLTKIFTQILNERLTRWVEENDLLPEFQSGFRKKGVASITYLS